MSSKSTTHSKRQLALFPLRVVLFEGGRLPLQVFETRYLDMISRCMRESQPFGVVLIRAGSDARLDNTWEQPEIFDIGTEAYVVDFNQLPNGRLGIIVKGGRKFRVLEASVQADHLLLGELVEVSADGGLGDVQPLGGLLDGHPAGIGEQFQQRVPAGVPVHRSSVCAISERMRAH